VLVSYSSNYQYLQGFQRHLFVSSSMVSSKRDDTQITIPREEYERLLQTEKDLQQAKMDQMYLVNEIANLKRMLFGKKSERFVEGVSSVKSEKEKTKSVTPREKSSSPGHAREPIPANLPREEVVIEPEESTEGLQCIGQSSSEYYAYIPGKLVVIKIIRPKYLN